MDREEHDGLMRGVAAVIKEQLRPLDERLRQLEERRVMAFEGSHDPGRQYRAGSVVQRGAGLWVCLAGRTSCPGIRRIGAAWVTRDDGRSRLAAWLARAGASR